MSDIRKENPYSAPASTVPNSDSDVGPYEVVVANGGTLPAICVHTGSTTGLESREFRGWVLTARNGPRAAVFMCLFFGVPMAVFAIHAGASAWLWLTVVVDFFTAFDATSAALSRRFPAWFVPLAMSSSLIATICFSWKGMAEVRLSWFVSRDHIHAVEKAARRRIRNALIFVALVIISTLMLRAPLLFFLLLLLPVLLPAPKFLPGRVVFITEHTCTLRGVIPAVSAALTSAGRSCQSPELNGA